MKKIFTLFAAVMAFTTLCAQDLSSLLNDGYDGKVVVTINDVVGIPNDANVIIVKKSDNKIDFTLKNFILSDGENVIPVGNVLLSDIELLAGDDGVVTFNAEQNILIGDGDMEGVPFWVGSSLGEIPVKLSGVALGEDMDIDIDIDLSASLEQIVHVDFYAGKYDPAGISSAKVSVNSGEIYNLNGQRIGMKVKGIVVKEGKKIIIK